MLRLRWLRRGLAALALVALLAPGSLRAETTVESPDSSGATVTSLVGALMGAACGAGINICRVAPVPIVAAVTVASCFLMVMDALATPDP